MYGPSCADTSFITIEAYQMNDLIRTNQELLAENFALKKKIQELEKSEADRKQAKDALQESLEILAKAEQIGHMGSWKMDVSHNTFSASAELRKIWGFAENEIISLEKVLSRFHPDDLDRMREIIQAAAGKGDPSVSDYRIILPDGTIRHISGNTEATLDPQGKTVFIHGTVQDMTEKKRLEDELIKAQKLESIGTLAGGLAHDYNNLLTVIMGNIELIKMDVSRTDKTYARLTAAESAAINARDLTQQLITFSQGGYPVSRIMPIRDLITESVRMSLSGSDTKTEWKVADDLPEVKIDETQICQVIHNIVINAREAMPQGGTLYIEADKTFLRPDNVLSLFEETYVRLIFRDEGPGISAEDLPRVFDPYFTTKDKGTTKGMGLGLSICYSIIKQHGGHILIDSKESIGTTVTIYIPAVMINKE
jgi:PAS domain S-box-containing protein